MMFEWLKKNLTAVYVLVAILSIISPWLLTRSWSGIDFTNTGEIGDTIGGLTAPFLNLLSVTLLYLTLKEQIKINEKQIEIRDIQLSNNDRNSFLSILTDFRAELNSIVYRYNGESVYGHEALLVIKDEMDKVDCNMNDMLNKSNILHCTRMIIRINLSILTYARLNKKSSTPLTDKYLFYETLNLYHEDIFNAIQSLSSKLSGIYPDLDKQIEENKELFKDFSIELPIQDI